MSARRVLAAVAIVGVAVVCTPAALVPVFNSADFICIFAPFALLVVLARRPKTPVEAPSSHPQADPQRGLDGLNQEGQDR